MLNSLILRSLDYDFLHKVAQRFSEESIKDFVLGLVADKKLLECEKGCADEMNLRLLFGIDYRESKSELKKLLEKEAENCGLRSLVYS